MRRRESIWGLFLLALFITAAGYADIDPTDPAGTVAANTLDTIIQTFKQDLLDGVAVEHDDGQTTAAHQGYHAFTESTNGALPAVANRPTGHVQLVNDLADQNLWKVNGGVTYDQVGVGLKTVVSGSQAVNTVTLATVTIQAYSASHREYMISAYTDSANNPTIVLGVDDGGADIYVYIQKDESGNDELVISNQTANNETVFYRIREIVG